MRSAPQPRRRLAVPAPRGSTTTRGWHTQSCSQPRARPIASPSCAERSPGTPTTASRSSECSATTATATAPTPGATSAPSSAYERRYTRPRRPQTNGKAEALVKTLLREWAYRFAYHSSGHRARALAGYLRWYNRHRPHSSLGGQPPIRRVSQVCGSGQPSPLERVPGAGRVAAPGLALPPDPLLAFSIFSSTILRAPGCGAPTETQGRLDQKYLLRAVGALTVVLRVFAASASAGSAESTAPPRPRSSPRERETTSAAPRRSATTPHSSRACRTSCRGKAKGKVHRVANGQYVQLERTGADRSSVILVEFGKHALPEPAVRRRREGRGRKAALEREGVRRAAANSIPQPNRSSPTTSTRRQAGRQPGATTSTCTSTGWRATQRAGSRPVATSSRVT